MHETKNMYLCKALRDFRDHENFSTDQILQNLSPFEKSVYTRKKKQPHLTNCKTKEDDRSLSTFQDLI